MPVFVADYAGPPCKKLYIYTEEENDFRGWHLIVDQQREDGTWEAAGNVWEVRYEDILRYPEDFAPKEIVWIDEGSGQLIDIYMWRPKES